MWILSDALWFIYIHMIWQHLDVLGIKSMDQHGWLGGSGRLIDGAKRRGARYVDPPRRLTKLIAEAAPPKEGSQRRQSPTASPNTRKRQSEWMLMTLSGTWHMSHVCSLKFRMIMDERRSNEEIWGPSPGQRGVCLWSTSGSAWGLHDAHGRMAGWMRQGLGVKLRYLDPPT